MAEGTETETTETETEPVYFNSNGTLAEGWQGTLEEGLREEKSLKDFKNVNDLAKSFVNTKSMVGKDTIAVPTDASTEIEWSAYHKAGGRPETVADYGFARPEDFPEEYYNQEYADGAQEILFKFGGSKKLGDALFEYNNKFVLAQLAQKVKDDELAMTELKNGLKTDWGNAYEQKVHLGNIAMAEATTTKRGDEIIVDEEFKARLVEKAGNDPDIIRAFANLGVKFTDHGTVDTFQNIPTPADYQAQIDEIQANPLYLKGTQEQRMKLANQIMLIRGKMKPKTT